MKQGNKLTEFYQENALVIADTLLQQHKSWHYIWTSPDDKYRIETDCILTAEDGEALYSQEKQGLELIVAQIMNSLSQNWDINWRK